MNKSLVNGIGDTKEVEKFYDDWSEKYDQSLLRWNYRAPKQSTKILSKFIKSKPKYLLDLACGTGLFLEEFRKIFPDCICDGSDISQKSINVSKKKKIYRKLYKSSFEKKILIKTQYNIVSLIGAMTYCNDHNLLLNLVFSYLKKGGYFIFTQRVDLWKKFNFNKILNDNSQFNIVYKSKPLKYLPKNEDFKSMIKIRIVLLYKNPS
jgi:predicted TPR repeat methyltransferase